MRLLCGRRMGQKPFGNLSETHWKPKPYKFIGSGAIDVTKPYKFTWFGAMDVTKPYKPRGPDCCLMYSVSRRSTPSP